MPLGKAQAHYMMITRLPEPTDLRNEKYHRWDRALTSQPRAGQLGAPKRTWLPVMPCVYYVTRELKF